MPTFKTTNYEKTQLTIFIFFLILIISCQKEDDFIHSQYDQINDIENSQSYGEKIILGKQLENPF